MCSRIVVRACVLVGVFGVGAVATAADEHWWSPDRQFRTVVTRATPWRDDAPRPVEAAIDFPWLLECAGIAGRFDPASLRVIERRDDGSGREVPFACRTEFDARAGRPRSYLAWIARPNVGEIGAYDIYFDTEERHLEAQEYEPSLLPPENLFANHGFEDQADGLPDDWVVTPEELIRLERFSHTTGERSLCVVVDERTPENAGREVNISQRIDASKFAGQEVS